MKRPAGNLLDWWKNRRKPKPQMMEISMSDYNELISYIKAVAGAHKEALSTIATLKNDGMAKDAEIKTLRDELASDELRKAEGIAILKDALNPDGGFSAGGVPA